MHQPPHFREDRLEVQRALIREYPLGLLITAGASGLIANPVPFLIDEDGAGLGVLRCHLARANPQWRELIGLEECMAVFQGPQAYVTPSWYPTKQQSGKAVPTWNYASVHVWGRPSVVQDPRWLREQIGDLTAQQESGRDSPWSVEDAPPDYISALLNGIIGVAISITRTEGKWKMSQNRPENDRAGVVAGLLREGDCEHVARLAAERRTAVEARK